MDFRRPLKSTPVVEACHALVREHVPFVKDDRVFATDMNQLHQLVTSGEMLATATAAAQKHNINLNNDESFGIY